MVELSQAWTEILTTGQIKPGPWMEELLPKAAQERLKQKGQYQKQIEYLFGKKVQRLILPEKEGGQIEITYTDGTTGNIFPDTLKKQAAKIEKEIAAKETAKAKVGKKGKPLSEEKEVVMKPSEEPGGEPIRLYGMAAKMYKEAQVRLNSPQSRRSRGLWAVAATTRPISRSGSLVRHGMG